MERLVSLADSLSRLDIVGSRIMIKVKVINRVL